VDVSLVPACVTRLLAVREDEDEVEVEDEDMVEEEDVDEVEEVHLSLWRRRYPLLLATWLPSPLGQSLLVRRWRGRTLWMRRLSGRLSMDFVSQEHGVPRDGPEDSNARG
jgi:hypothetical protein